MNRKASPPAIETAAISIAVLSLGGAMGFAVARLAPLDAGPIEASGAGLLAALAGWVLIGRVDRGRGPQSLAAAVAVDVMDEDALLLDQIDEDEALLLDDPLPLLRDDSRVVRLFAALPGDSEGAAPLIGPSEMIARIEDFLGQSHASSTGEPARSASQGAPADASTALHMALADIRRSLRQA